MLLALAVAVTTPGNVAQNAPIGNDGPAANLSNDGNLIIYRSRIAPLLFRVAIEIDGRKAASLANGDALTIRIPPGPHRISLKWPMLSGESGGSTDIRIGDEGRVYLAIVAKGWGGLMRNPPTTLQTIDEESAIAAITKCCRPVPPGE